eukprot:SAG22_NODE_136_length_18095_cov_19.897255_6_plen_178_part_00
MLPPHLPRRRRRRNRRRFGRNRPAASNAAQRSSEHPLLVAAARLIPRSFCTSQGQRALFRSVSVSGSAPARLKAGTLVGGVAAVASPAQQLAPGGRERQPARRRGLHQHLPPHRVLCAEVASCAGTRSAARLRLCGARTPRERRESARRRETRQRRRGDERTQRARQRDRETDENEI